jgi:hypothetical protein
MKHKLKLICNIQIDDLVDEIVKVTRKLRNEVEDELMEEYFYPEVGTDYCIYQSQPIDPDEPSWIYEVIDSILFKINDFDEVRIWR